MTGANREYWGCIGSEVSVGSPVLHSLSVPQLSHSGVPKFHGRLAVALFGSLSLGLSSRWLSCSSLRDVCLR